MAETLYKFFDARVLEWENLVEAANNHQTILIYVSSLRQHTYAQNTNDSKHGHRPIHCGSMKVLTKDMATKHTMWIHTSMTRSGCSHDILHSGATI
jgi:hypothetical protein